MRFIRWCGHIYGVRTVNETQENLAHPVSQVAVATKFFIKCAIVQALRLCTGRTAHRGSRGISLLFL